MSDVRRTGRIVEEPTRARRRPGGVRGLTISVLLIWLAACMPAAPSGSSPSPPADTGTLAIEVVAGPVCPVERDPPDPACAPRPVVGARIFVQPGDGRDIVVAEATTNEAGEATLELPAGDYLVIGLEVSGLMGRPEPASATVSAGRLTELGLAYDTGIR